MFATFGLLEYQAIRKEILELKARVRREFILGLTGIPIMLGSARALDINELLVILPVTIIAGALMLLFEQNSIMRAGTYIRCFVEEKYLDDKAIGWETWLESTAKCRRPSNYFRFSVAATFFFFYLVASLLAKEAAEVIWSAGIAEYVGYVYVGGLFFFMYFLLRHWHIHTRLQTQNICELYSDRKIQKVEAISADRRFLLKEFQCLRQEILELKERVIKVFSVGLIGIPVLLGTSIELKLHILLILSPIISVVGALVLLFEHNSIMRAGRYIREVIEPRVSMQSVYGWERFLERHKEHTRSAERYFHFSAMLAFGFYYLAGMLLAHDVIARDYGESYADYSRYIYGSGFLFFVYFLGRYFWWKNE